MKKLLSTFSFIAIFASLGLTAYIALPRNIEVVSGDVTVTNASADLPPVLAPSADKYNIIGFPLVDNTVTTASELAVRAANGGNGIKQVLRYRSGDGGFDAYFPPTQDGYDFPISVGNAIFILADSTVSNVVSFVGDVPDQGSVSIVLVPQSGGGCNYNIFSIPLDQTGVVSDAASLANEIESGNASYTDSVEQVLQFRASDGGFDAYFPLTSDGDNFQVKAGYPYFVCLRSNGPTSWP